MSDQSTVAETVEAAIAENRTWFMILGILLIILGIAAISFPLMSTIAAKILIGWLLLIGGVVQVIHAFATQKWSAFVFNLLIGVLYAFVGGWLAFFPLAGIITLTVLLAAGFVAQGIVELVMALKLRPMRGWMWVLISGLLAAVVGILIFAQLPSSAIWAIGLLTGINLLSSGWAYLFIALAAGKKV